MTLYDIGDAIFFLGHHTQVTGIQRVVLAFVDAIERSAEENPHYRFVAFSQSIGTYVVLDNAATHEIFASIRAQGVTPKIKRRFYEMALGDYKRLSGQRIDFSAFRDANLCILGAAWMFDNLPTLRWAKNEFGLKISCLIYDIIPLTYPQYVTADLRQVFANFLHRMTDIADVLLTISDYIARELKEYIESRGLRCPTIHPLQLSTFQPSEHGTQRSVRDLVGPRNYVLYVSTIEVRKNHRSLFDIWAEFAQEGGDFPDLVFVGRLGWKVADLIRDFSETHHLDGHLHVLSDVSDAELVDLYRNAAFLAYPSFCEGWGLPVTEALSFGTPVLCSDTTSLPEAGQSVARYLPPHDREAWKRTIRDWAADPELRSRFDFTALRIPTWGTILSDLLRAIEAAPAKPERTPTIRPREIVHFADERMLDVRAVEKFDRSTRRRTLPGGVGEMRYGPNWSFREGWGHWSIRGVLRLSYQPAQVAGHATVLFLRVPDQLLGGRFVVNLNGERDTITTHKRQFLLCIPMTADLMRDDAQNVIEIMSLDKGAIAAMRELDAREPTIGVEAATVMKLDDMPVWTTLCASAHEMGRGICWAFA